MTDSHRPAIISAVGNGNRETVEHHLVSAYVWPPWLRIPIEQLFHKFYGRIGHASMPVGILSKHKTSQRMLVYSECSVWSRRNAIRLLLRGK